MKETVLRSRFFRQIAQIYGFRLYNIKEIPSFYLSRVAYRAGTDRGFLFIKLYRGNSKRLNLISGYLRKLKSRGFREMPKWLAAKNGSLWIRLKGRLYYVTRWIGGRQIRMKEADMYRLGRALSKLHTLSGRFASVPSKPRETAIRELYVYSKRFRKMLPTVSCMDSEEGRWFQQEGQKAMELTDLALKRLVQPEMKKVLAMEKKRPSLTHGDITIPNVKISGGKVFLLDWELIGKKSALFELAKALTNLTGFSIPLMNALLQGYHSKRNLSREKREIVSVLFRIPREAWYACENAYLGRSPIMFHSLRDTWTQRLTAIEWLDTWARN